MNLKEMRADAEKAVKETGSAVDKALETSRQAAREATATSLPRVTCPACEKDVPKRVGGYLREHLDETGEKCWGSGKLIADVEDTLEKRAKAAQPRGLVERAQEAVDRIAEDAKITVPPAAQSPEAEVLAQTFAILPLDRVLPDPGNREVGDIDELMESIRVSGVLEPVLVVPDFDASEPDVTRYRLIAGHRRRAATEKLGLLGIPAIIKTFEALERSVAALVSNVQRKDLTPLEEAKGYQVLVDHGLDQKDVAEKVGKSQGHVSKRLGLLKLPEVIQEAIVTEEVTLETAQQVGRLRSPKAMVAAFESAKEYGGHGTYSVDRALRETVESAIRQAEATVETKRIVKDLEAQGFKVTEDEELFVTYPLQWGAGPRWIGKSYGNLNANAKEHEAEPCHAFYVPFGGPARPVCMDPARHKRGGDSKLRTTIKGLDRGPAKKAETPEAKEARETQEAAVAELEEAQAARRQVIARALGKFKAKDLGGIATLRAVAWSAIDDDYCESGAILECLGGEAGLSFVQANQELEKFLLGDDGSVDEEKALLFWAAEVLAVIDDSLVDFSKLYRPSGSVFEPVSWSWAQPYFDWLSGHGYAPIRAELDRLQIDETGRRSA